MDGKLPLLNGIALIKILEKRLIVLPDDDYHILHI